MLSREDNELLCRVGRGTPTGDLLRQYWIPALMIERAPGARRRRPFASGSSARISSPSG